MGAMAETATILRERVIGGYERNRKHVRRKMDDEILLNPSKISDHLRRFGIYGFGPPPSIWKKLDGSEENLHERAQNQMEFNLFSF
jgi:hypothetical protein